ncbi:hypothetical protein D9M69_565110 [compost metagenome]
MHVAHGRHGQAAGAENAEQFALDQGDLCAVHRHIGAGAHGNADIGSRQRGCVVDAVASHCHTTPRLLQAGYQALLVLWPDLAMHFIDA